MLPTSRRAASVITYPIARSCKLVYNMFTDLEHNSRPIVLAGVGPGCILDGVGRCPGRVLCKTPTLLRALARLIHSNMRFSYIVASNALVPSN